MSRNENHRRVHGGIRSVKGLRRVGLASAVLATFIACAFVARPSRGQLLVVAPKADFGQAANNDSPDPPYGVGNVHWIGSIVHAGNSKYYEGMSNPQRVVFDDISATTGNVHTLSLSHQATKGGIHAYDFVTSWEQAVLAANAVLPPPPGLLTGDNTPVLPFYQDDGCDAEIGPPASLGATCTNLRAGANCVVVSVPDDPFISKDGSTQSRINAYESSFGNRTVRICGNQSISSASLTLCGHDPAANGSDTGDSEINYILTWTSTSTQLVVEMAGHLSVSGDPNVNPVAWGVGLGAAQIAGGSYHFKLDNLGGAASAPPGCVQSEVTSLGSQDNAISGADIICLCPDCDDQIACTIDACDQNTCTCESCPCTHTPDHSACDDNNSCTIDTCDVVLGCVHTPVSESTPCEAETPPDLCTNDHCNGSGSCVFMSNKTCAPAIPPCEGGESCNPGTGLCVPNADAPFSTLCELDGDLCTNDHCNGVGQCVFLNNKTCQPPNLPCEGGEVCVAGICTPLADAVLSTPCEADADLCTTDHCNGTGLCVFLSNVSCQPPNLPCEGGEVCVGGNCVAQPDAQLSTPCEADADLCTNDHCNGSGSCVFKDNVVCPADTECATYDCNPGTGVCDVTFKVLSTVCERDGNKCTNDHCDGGGNCVFLSAVTCPGGAGVCEAGERCDPADGLCKVLPDAPFSTPCEEDMNFCTIEHCDGIGNCVILQNVTCAPAVPPCEGGEYCEPSTGACLDNPDAALSTSCQADSNLCTIDHCNGSGTCVTFDFVDCADAVAPCEGGQYCEPTTGACVDNPDATLSTPCQADADLCTIDHCNGNGVCVTFDNVDCADPVPPCEAGEQCNPSSGLCIPLTDAEVSTPCEANGNLCTVDHCNGQGLCVFLRDVLCQPPNPPCEGGEVCNPSTGLCVPQPDAVLSTPCEANGNLCTIDHCDGQGQCVHLSDVVCQPADPPCEAGEVCNPGTGLCVPNPDAPLSTPCEADADPCTRQHCDGNGNCVLEKEVCGACCDGTTGNCVNDLFEVDCRGDQRAWYQGSLCSEIPPPGCVQHRGACCNAALPGGVCTDGVLPGDCVNVLPADQLTWFKAETCAVVESSGRCDEHRGACCDRRIADPVLRCEDLPESECPIDDPTQQSWTKGTACADLGPECTEHTGACCDQRIANPALRCRDDVPASECVIDDPGQVSWYKFTACADITCGEHTGACCDEDPFGTCQDNVPASQCNCTKCLFYKDTPCSAVGCVHNSIPTVSQWGLAILTLLLLTGAKIYFGRRQADAA